MSEEDQERLKQIDREVYAKRKKSDNTAGSGKVSTEDQESGS